MVSVSGLSVADGAVEGFDPAGIRMKSSKAGESRVLSMASCQLSTAWVETLGCARLDACERGNETYVVGACLSKPLSREGTIGRGMKRYALHC